jgi:chromosome segregation ATPase
VRGDRNTYRKTQIELKNDIGEYKRKFINLNMQIKQLKDEISEKDIGFVTEHFNLEHVRADIHQLQSLNKATQLKVEQMDEVIKGQSGQTQKLNTIIADADEELHIQTKQYNSVINEQRVLNMQLIQRNEELAKLYDELKLQNSLLQKGRKQYNVKKSALRKMQDMDEELGSQLDTVNEDHDKYEELLSTIEQLKRDLIEEKLKTKALSDELAKPINIHRWRRLQDTNSDAYSMIKRVRRLQKNIIKKSSQVDQKDKEIQEKEKLYVDLRRVLARQPGSEAAEQLRIYTATLREKRGKFKTMKSELKMYQTKVYEFKYDITKIQEDLKMLQMEYFTVMKKQQRAERSSRASTARGMTANASRGDGGYGAEFAGQDGGDFASELEANQHNLKDMPDEYLLKPIQGAPDDGYENAGESSSRGQAAMDEGGDFADTRPQGLQGDTQEDDSWRFADTVKSTTADSKINISQASPAR